jgi:hypothetical protein
VSVRPTIDDVSPVLRAVAAVGLPTLAGNATDAGAEVAPLELTLTDVDAAVDHRIEGLLVVALKSGVVRASDEVCDRAFAAHLDALERCLMVEESAVRAVVALDSHGIDHRVLKGVALAHLDYQDPAERIFADVDLLVRRADRRAALDALTADGFRRLEPPVREGWEQRFGKAVVLRAPERTLLDLHLSVTGGYFGTMIPHDRLWACSPEVFELAGHEMRALAVRHRFVQACCHTVLGGGSGLRAVRDVAELACSERLTPEMVMEECVEWGVDQVIADAIRIAWQTLGLDPSHSFHQWAATHADDPVQQRAVSGYVAAREAGWGPEGMTVLRALGPTDRARFITGLMWPSAESLRHRGRTRWAHLASLCSAVMRRR